MGIPSENKTREERQLRLANKFFGESALPITEQIALDEATDQINNATHTLTQESGSEKGDVIDLGTVVPKSPIYMLPTSQQTTRSAWVRAAGIGCECFNAAFFSVLAVGTVAATSPQAKELLLKFIP